MGVLGEGKERWVDSLSVKTSFGGIVGSGSCDDSEMVRFCERAVRSRSSGS